MIGMKVINELCDSFRFSLHTHSHTCMAQGDYETHGWWTLYGEAQPNKGELSACLHVSLVICKRCELWYQN